MIAAGASANTVGGIEFEAGNTISANAFYGVLVQDSGTGNSIRRNRIFGNNWLGINLSSAGELPYGVTPNDLGDTDSGPNGLQNFPVLDAAAISVTNTIVSGTLRSLASRVYSVDIYASTSLGTSGYGEGENWAGSVTVNADASGFAAFNLTILAPLVGKFITATATSAAGDTSEFSQGIPVAGVVVNPPLISTQPPSATVTNGFVATFTVTSTGSMPLSYQWRFGASPIVGATNATLTLTNVQ